MPSSSLAPMRQSVRVRSVVRPGFVITARGSCCSINAPSSLQSPTAASRSAALAAGGRARALASAGSGKASIEERRDGVAVAGREVSR